MVDQHAGIDTPEPTLAFDQECQVFAIWLRLNFQKSGQALFVEEPGRESIGRCKAPNRLARTLRRTP